MVVNLVIAFHAFKGLIIIIRMLFLPLAFHPLYRVILSLKSFINIVQ
jgi:hypothetical protein